MNQQREFIAKLITSLESSGIPYMVTGSVCSSIHGEPRATRDIDIIIDPTEQQLRAFVRMIGEDYYCSEEAAQDALTRRFMFNVIDALSGWKADLIIRKNTPFERAKFQRSQKSVFFNVPITIATPEDTILSKLLWSKTGDSERQLRDALGVALVQWETMDWEYLHRWAPELGVEKLLEELLREAEQLKP
ncbi:MAG: hypothetical protein ABH878_09180 [bacterium]